MENQQLPKIIDGQLSRLSNKIVNDPLKPGKMNAQISLLHAICMNLNRRVNELEAELNSQSETNEKPHQRYT